MKSAEEIRNQLEAIASSPNFVSDSANCTDSWEAEGLGVTSMRPILRFMEDHPSLDFGKPGPLTHFIERFDDGYNELLLESIIRKPTPHTLWLLNRVINGTTDEARRENLIDVFQSVLLRNDIGPETIDEAKRFLTRLRV